ncbi:Rrf2 family transcriptional regulator [Acidaminobacter sp. JC074]|nr:Rrf2 family transcriptional regulator [Acidaminobacter sp. JC074]
MVRGNTQFSVATHILALVGLSEHYNNHMPTSAEIADSVNTNPVVIRRIISLLKNAGFVSVRAGVGGVGLLKSPESISLLDIYKAIQTGQNTSVFDYHHNTKQSCPIGGTINTVLSSKLDAAQKKMEDELVLTSLYIVMKEIAELNGSEL